jgi:hypothetical protein
MSSLVAGCLVAFGLLGLVGLEIQYFTTSPLWFICRPWGRPESRYIRPMVVFSRAGSARAGVTIPDNGGWHTFISMHVPHYESIDKTALEADNSVSVIKSNYWAIVTREAAARYWAIVPRNVSG